METIRNSYWVIHVNQEIITDQEGKYLIFESLSTLILYLGYELDKELREIANYDQIIIDTEDLEMGINIIN
jgi:hypothetical protein